MGENRGRLAPGEVADLLCNGRVHVFDPATGEQVAQVDYRPDGIVHAVFAAGGEDRGTWGLNGETYWTRYARFRDGAVSTFYLEWVSDGVAQAYHTDGRRAFLQSRRSEIGARKG